MRDGDEVYVHLVSGECPAYSLRLVEKTAVQTMHVIVYSRHGAVRTDDVERVAVDEVSGATRGAEGTEAAAR